MDTNIELKEAEVKEMTPETAHEETKSKGVSVKGAVIVAIIIILGALAFYYKGVFIAATVDGAPISRLSVISEIEKTSGKQALDGLITKKLLHAAAKKAGIVVTTEELNAEVAKIDEQVKAQGGTLDQMLATQGMVRKDMEEQIVLQKELEKLLADKIAVTDEEADKLLVDSKVVVPKGEEEKFKEQAKEQIKGQKLNDAARTYLDALHADASIKYFVNY